MRLKSQTYEVRCADGNPRTVYRRVDDAFPLYLPKFSAKVAASVRDLAGNGVGIDGDVENGIDGLLYHLSETNDSMMMSFRAAYVAYQADPCGNSTFLARKVDELTTELQRLTGARLELKALIELAASRPTDTRSIWKRFTEVVIKYGLPGAPQASRERILSARRAADRWIGG